VGADGTLSHYRALIQRRQQRAIPIAIMANGQVQELATTDRAFTVGLAKSFRMALSSASFHCRATDQSGSLVWAWPGSSGAIPSIMLIVIINFKNIL